MTAFAEKCPKAPSGHHRWARRREGIQCIWCRAARWGEELPQNGQSFTLEDPTHTEPLVVGRYRLGRHPLGGYWILKEDGKGMQVSEAKLEELIDDFFKREF